MTADFEIKQGDEVPDLSGTLTEVDGSAVDLTGCTLRISVRPIRGTVVVVDGAVATIDQQDLEIFPDSKGTWHYTLDAAELLGGYFVELILTDGGGDDRTFPIRGWYTLAVYERIGVGAS